MADSEQFRRRAFTEVRLSRGQLLTSADRFGPEAPGAIRQREIDFITGNITSTTPLIDHVPASQITTESPYQGEDPPPLERTMPDMQCYRNNLTALSRKFNLYFVAYENRIFVYRPRNAPRQPIPAEPDLIIATKPDKIACRIGGALDHHFFHQTNTLVTGNLGGQEVLVTAYDDGSVFAYYVRHFAEYIKHTLTSDNGTGEKPSIPQPFFKSNVGASAWGIAIHSVSRLIAISSNRYEVTVFAFGLASQPRGPKKVDLEYCAKSVAERKRNWRIVLLLGEDGHNIPNICFWDDRDGLAEKVCAMDIKGATWILDIWNPKTKPIRIPHMCQPQNQRPMFTTGGWGILVLPYSNFIPVSSPQEAFGVEHLRMVNIEQRRTNNDFAVDISNSLCSVRDSASIPRELRSFISGPASSVLNQHAVSLMHALLGNAGALMNGPPPANPALLDSDDSGEGESASDEDLQQDAHSDDNDAESDDSASDLGQGGSGAAAVLGTHGSVEEEPDEESDYSDGDEDSESPGDSDDSNASNGPTVDQLMTENNNASNQNQGNGGLALVVQGGAPQTDVDVAVVPPVANMVPVLNNEDDEDDGVDSSEDEGQDEEQDDEQDEEQEEDTDSEDQLEVAILTQAQARSWAHSDSQDRLSFLAPYGIRRVTPPEGAISIGQRTSPQVQPLFDMMYMPHSGHTYTFTTATLPQSLFFRRGPEYNENRTQQDRAMLKDMVKRSCLFRTYVKDMEMRSIGSNGASIVCRSATGDLPRSQVFRHSERLSMLYHIPELSLVVAGSAVGRVVLLTPTKSRDPRINLAQGIPNVPESAPGQPEHVTYGFRVEWVLPRLSDEEHTRLRPLYGVAVGPVQEGDPARDGINLVLRRPHTRGSALGPGSEVWRLILHWRDHNITSYEIRRDEEGKLDII